MTKTNLQFSDICIVEDQIQMSLTELAHASHAEVEHIIAWVYEGILSPTGNQPKEWQFEGNSLQRAKKALCLSRDLEINTPGIALVLDLLEEIARLQQRT